VKQEGNLGSSYLTPTRHDLIAVTRGGAIGCHSPRGRSSLAALLPRSILARADEVIE